MRKRIRLGAKIGALLVGGAVLVGNMTGCGVKQMDCQVTEKHAHKYITGTGFETYRKSENEKIDNAFWTNKVTDVTPEIEQMGQFNLYSISDNIEALQEIIDKNVPFTRYEYSYYEDYLAFGVALGNIPLGLAMSDTKYGWTTDIGHSSLTGNAQNVGYKYYGYRTYTDEKGRTQVIQSQPVDDIFTIATEYPYFKPDNLSTFVYGDSYTKEAQKVKE